MIENFCESSALLVQVFHSLDNKQHLKHIVFSLTQTYKTPFVNNIKISLIFHVVKKHLCYVY